ncbi:MAG TPA: phosphoribosylaminoimidazolesuccinocarboxamide synthase [Gemmatimonadales bacterium]|nr:phosphoribosylaminoimidazolesuccinocarboxamide synthase [Gemmatimonadales bacterium]
MLAASHLPLPLWRHGKVREVYEVDDHRLLLVASDRVSAFDVVMEETVPGKGIVLTQLSAFWFGLLRGLGPTQFITAETDLILAEVPGLAPYRDQVAGRATLVHRTEPVSFECVVRGYLAGSAWAEYRRSGTLAGEPLPAGLSESAALPAPVFSPATKAASGHDENVPYAVMVSALGEAAASELRARSLVLYEAGRAHAAARGIIIADTKFEFGRSADGTLLLIDELLTPDSSRFWPADRHAAGRSQPSYDKQPLRDYLDGLRQAGSWDGNAPPPPLPPEVVAATSTRYHEAFHVLTGHVLERA